VCAFIIDCNAACVTYGAIDARCVGGMAPHFANAAHGAKRKVEDLQGTDAITRCDWSRSLSMSFAIV
jgi:hypothetical protein